MPKLQQTIRSNGSVITYVNLPQEDVEAAGWKKGDELAVARQEVNGAVRLIIMREQDVRKFIEEG